MLHDRIRQSWLGIYAIPGNLASCTAYYTALSHCVTQHQGLLRAELAGNAWLNTLLNLDPSQCVIHQPTIQLDREFTRAKQLVADGINKKGFIHYVTGILSDIAMPKSGLECPSDRCHNGDGGMLRYIFAQKEHLHRELILICDTCAYAADRNGIPLCTQGSVFYPVLEEDLKRAVDQ